MPEAILKDLINLVLVDDVKLSVWHMNKLPRETRAKFTSDIGFVADYLNEGSFESRKNQKIVHVEALCKMMEARGKAIGKEICETGFRSKLLPGKRGGTGPCHEPGANNTKNSAKNTKIPKVKR